jgi:hypothetical protein
MGRDSGNCTRAALRVGRRVALAVTARCGFRSAIVTCNIAGDIGTRGSSGRWYCSQLLPVANDVTNAGATPHSSTLFHAERLHQPGELVRAEGRGDCVEGTLECDSQALDAVRFETPLVRGGG